MRVQSDAESGRPGRAGPAEPGVHPRTRDGGARLRWRAVMHAGQKVDPARGQQRSVRGVFLVRSEGGLLVAVGSHQPIEVRGHPKILHPEPVGASNIARGLEGLVGGLEILGLLLFACVLAVSEPVLQPNSVNWVCREAGSPA